MRQLRLAALVSLLIGSAVACTIAADGDEGEGEGESGEGEGEGDAGEGEGEGQQGEGEGDNSGSVEVGVSASSGGTVNATDGAALTVPAGSLTSDEVVTISVSNADVDGYDMASSVYELGPAGLTFSERVSVSIPTTAGQGFAVFWSKADRPDEYEPVPTVSGAGFKVAFVTHFSTGFVARADDDACADVECDDPPAPSCADANTENVVGEGTCVAGECVYPTTQVACPTDIGSTGCEDGSCQIDCSMVEIDGDAFDNCDGVSGNGCEAALAIDEQNCGACGNPCSATERCLDGTCIERHGCEIMLDDCLIPCIGQGVSDAPTCFQMCSAGLSGAEQQRASDAMECAFTYCEDSGEPDCLSTAYYFRCRAYVDDCRAGTDTAECQPLHDDGCEGECRVCEGGLCVDEPGCNVDSGRTCAMAAGDPCVVDCLADGGDANICIDDNYPAFNCDEGLAGAALGDFVALLSCVHQNLQPSCGDQAVNADCVAALYETECAEPHRTCAPPP